jgi:hypothetical protein
VRVLGLLVSAILAIAVIGFVASMFVRVPGGLASYDSAISAKMPVDGVYAFGMGPLTTGKLPVRVEDVRLHEPPPGVELVGAFLYYGNGCFGAGVIEKYPPCSSRSRVPARKGVVPAHRRYLLWVGVRVSRPGSFRVRGVDVRYRMRLGGTGLELRRSAHVGNEMDICAPRPRCTVPAFQSGF